MEAIRYHQNKPASAAPRRFWPLTAVVVLTAVAMPVVSGCGGDAAPGSRTLPELELTEVARIGGDAGPEAVEFGRIADLAIGDDGTVYVLDGLNRVVYAFDERGSLRTSFGGRGSGPGELEEPNALLRGPDGTLWVVDAGNGRYTIYEPDGGLMGTLGGDEPFAFYPLAAGFSDAGRLYTVTLEFGRLEQPSAELVEAEIGDDAVRALRRLALPFEPWPEPFEHSAGGQVLVLPVPFAPEPAFRLDGLGRVWYASGADPWVQRWTPDVGIEQRYGRELDPPTVTSAEREAALDEPHLEGLRAAAGPAGIAELSRRIPDRKPHLRGFFLDDVGNVWIMPTPGAEAGPVGGASGPPMAASVMEVYRPDGTPLGVAQVYLEAEPWPRARNGLLAGVIRDEMGVESVMLYRLGNSR